MLKTSIKIAGVIAMLTIASHASQAEKFNQSPYSIYPIANNGITEASCERDYDKCVQYVLPLCRRLLKRGLGGGSMGNCEERKLRRCFSKYNKCLGKL